MICDLVGSTALSARLDPEDMREIIGAYHRCCAEQITKAGGFVAKYMGDGVLAYFGYPQAHEDDAERAVRVGLGLIEAVPMLRTSHDAELQVRIGIATGLVVVGDLIGEGAAQERGVVGDTPNVAARLQTMAEPGQVVISNTTRRLTRGLFDYRDLGRVTLKGLSEAVQTWEVLGPSGVQSRFEAQHETGLTPLIGRVEELEVLLRRWRQAALGEGRVVLISGEPGIGKSRLIAALQERLQCEPHRRLRYFCSPLRAESPLYPFISGLRRAAKFAPNDTPQQRLAKFVSLLVPTVAAASLQREDMLEQKVNALEALLASTTAYTEQSVALLADLLEVPTVGRHRLSDLSPNLRKQKTMEALVTSVASVAAQRPVLLVAEDVHWMDPTSLELLTLTVERIEHTRALVIITARPEFAAPWPEYAHVSTLNLARLSHREGAALVKSVAGDEALPDGIMVEIVQRTDGIPLFVEELTKAVLEAGVDNQGDRGTVSTLPLSALAVPATLNASLMARLDRLGPVAKEVAQIGAAIGREFSYELLAPVAERTEGELRGALTRLCDAGLVFRRGTPPYATFLFKHALVRDAAYSTLLRSRRQQLHASIVDTLERRFPEIVAAEPALFAHHCEEAGLIEKAIDNRLKAGKQAVARSAMAEGVAQLQKGLNLLASLPACSSLQQRELDLLAALGPALAATKGYSAPAVGKTFDRALALAAQLDRPDQLLPLLYGQWAYHLIRSDLTVALSLGEQLVQVGVARNDVIAQWLGHYVSGATLIELAEFVAARAQFEQCHGFADPAHQAVSPELLPEISHAALLSYYGRNLCQLGYLDQGRSRLNEALSAADRVGHTYSRAVVRLRAALAALSWGSLQEARRHGERLRGSSGRTRFSASTGSRNGMARLDFGRIRA